MQKMIETGQEIIRKIKSAGHEAFFVGGFVRDYLLGIPSSDIDITTSATPTEIETLFEKVFLTGAAFGTVTVLKNDYSFEITTYRKESNYDNHRHPSDISYSKDLLEDLSRRDFTINQLTMDENLCVEDYYGGIHDLTHKIIKTINEPNERFKEDALRLLRAFRFVAKLNFSIDKDTLKAIQTQKSLILKISIERIQNELFKLLDAPYKQKAIGYMIDTGFAKTLYNLEDGFKRLRLIEDKYNYLEALTILFLESGYDESLWKLSNKDKTTIKSMTKYHLMTKEEGFSKPLLFTAGLEEALAANRINKLLGYKDKTETIKKMYETLPIKGVCDLAFKGQDIIKSFNINNRQHIGILLDEIILEVLSGALENTYETIKDYAKQRLNTLERSE